MVRWWDDLLEQVLISVTFSLPLHLTTPGHAPNKSALWPTQSLPPTWPRLELLERCM